MAKVKMQLGTPKHSKPSNKFDVAKSSLDKSVTVTRRGGEADKYANSLLKGLKDKGKPVDKADRAGAQIATGLGTKSRIELKNLGININKAKTKGKK